MQVAQVAQTQGNVFNVRCTDALDEKSNDFSCQLVFICQVFVRSFISCTLPCSSQKKPTPSALSNIIMSLAHNGGTGISPLDKASRSEAPTKTQTRAPGQ